LSKKIDRQALRQVREYANTIKTSRSAKETSQVARKMSEAATHVIRRDPDTDRYVPARDRR
jgi:hypothetical protein